MGPDRLLRSAREDRPALESGLLDIEFDEAGTIRLFCGRASDNLNSTTRVVLEAVIAGLTRRVVVTAAVLARESSYFGPWILGLAVTNLRGAVSYYASQHLIGQVLAFSEDDYRMTTEASFEDLQGNHDELVQRLFGRLNRALTAGRFDPTFGDTPAAS